MADTYVTCTVSPCTVVHSVDIPPLNLDEAGASALAAAIISVWAAGFVIRMLIRALRSDEGNGVDERE